ncbi:MAG: hypothetical protein Q4A61_05015 [Porphyromonadaceae bacterium]|nr:hypothetical protein [Porphyromonadaceae bacterium]
MQQNYPFVFEAEYIRLALDAAELRRGTKHQQTLERLRFMARIVNV